MSNPSNEQVGLGTRHCVLASMTNIQNWGAKISGTLK